MTSHNYCVILAGGKGRRLWPASRESKPKQFLDFFGVGRTQLQQTYDRFAAFIPRENILLNTTAPYLDLVKEQLPEVSDDNIMTEPIHRNTGPSATWAAHRAMMLDPEASLIISPSDQAITNEEAFRRNMTEALSITASNYCTLAMGVKPTRAEPGYGYIQLGEAESHGVYRVKSFVEKPEREFAKMFLDSGEFYWNTSLFVGNAKALFDSFARQLPPVLREFADANSGSKYSINKENKYIEKNFSTYPNMTIEECLFEKSDTSYVMKCDFEWADIGTWHGLYEAMPHSEGNNVVVDSNARMINSHGNIVKLSNGKLAVIQGLENYIVADFDDVLLICQREDSSSLIRKFINDIKFSEDSKFV